MRESSTVIISDTQFTNNTAVSDGGVGNAYRNSTITINGSTLENNIGDYGGTLVAFQSSSLKFYMCSFKNNSANFGGVARIHQSSTCIVNGSNFTLNKALDSGGVIFLQRKSAFNADNSNFDFNAANFGGIIYAEQESFITASNSCFNNSTAKGNGGVISAHINTVFVINDGDFGHNSVGLDGGVIRLSENSTTVIRSSTFTNNSAGRDGGVLYGIDSCYMTVEYCSFLSNGADDDGGVVYIQRNCSVLLQTCSFNLSTAGDNGGVIFMFDGSLSNIMDSNFSQNGAGGNGGAVYGQQACIVIINGSTFSNNTAESHGGVIHIEEGNSMSMNECVCIYNNAAAGVGGVLSAHTRNTVSVDNTKFSYNMAYEKGGALAIDNSTVALDETYAQNLTFSPQSIIMDNKANEGGGVSLSNGRLYFKGETIIANNLGAEKGGGVHAVDSSITVEREVQFVNNVAAYGGGINFEMDAKVYVLAENNSVPLLAFTQNKANYGGAIHVADETYPLLCSSLSPLSYSTSSVCFFQSLYLESNAQNIYFSNNLAEMSGSNLFGGLLDRCTIRNDSPANGATTFKKLGGITELESITSDPVRICFCKDGYPDCTYMPPPIEIMRGETIALRIVAVDQVNRTINDTIIHASLNSTFGTLDEGQEAQRTHEGCTELSFDLLSTSDSEQLLLYAEGPCTSKGISQISAMIQILPCSCPIGFARSERDTIRCVCECDPELGVYVSECYPSEQAIVRKGNFWITHVNTSLDTGYLIFPNCPLDYILPSTQ